MNWRFSSVDIIEDYKFHNAIDDFYQHGVTGLIRENIQNSLDAKKEDSEDPVVIDIEIGQIDYDSLPGIEKIKNRILSLKGQNDHEINTINHMQSILMNSPKLVSYMSIEDNNTQGLDGSKEGYNKDNPTIYQAYAYSKGVNEKTENEEYASGGSHGVGKIASNAASDLHLMYFSNHDQEGYQTLGGNVQLIDHEFQGKAYRGTGYFIEDDSDRYLPVLNKGFHDVFQKSTRGLKIVIPFLRKKYNNDGVIIRAIIDSFLLAIMDNKLIVNYKDKVISKETLESFLFNDAYYAYDDLETMMKDDKIFTPEYYKTIRDHYLKTFTIEDKKNQNYLFKVYFQYNEEFPAGRTGLFRKMGMKIQDMKISGYVLKPYNAVLIPLDKKEDIYLRSLENQSHTELDHENYKNSDEQDNADHFIKQLNRQMQNIIEEEIEKLTPAEGELFTNDILYEINTDFKKHLSKKTTKLNSGLGDGSTSVVQTTKTDEKGLVGKKGRKGNKRDVYLTPVKRTFGGDEKKIYYAVNSSAIRRTVIKDYEIVNIHLGNSEMIDQVENCHINLTWFDGMGKQHIDQFDLRDFYDEILDVNDGNRIVDYETNRILDLSIVNQSIELRMKKTLRRNNVKLKFYLEV